MKTNRQYVIESEQRRRDQGLTRACVWVPNTKYFKSRIKAYAKELVEEFNDPTSENWLKKPLIKKV